jgi:hypothetical protein
MTDRLYTGHVCDKQGRVLFTSHAYPTRDECVSVCFAARPKAKTCCTGYGYNGTFDIRWHRRDLRDLDQAMGW